MTTKLYFHEALSLSLATLPVAQQSALGAPAKTADAVTVNRSMNTTIGTTQTSKAVSTNASASAQVVYFTRFVSEPLNTTSISANTWTIGYADQENNANANFPVTTSGALRITVYVWRPSTNSKVANILDGTGPTVAEATTSETTTYGTFSGSAVTTQIGDVICCELIYSITQGNATARTITVYYDGTTEPASDNAAASTAASFISTPEDLAFISLTKLYFHDELNPLANLPTAEQSTLTSIKNVDAQTVNRLMDTSVGLAQASIALTSNNTASAQDYYFTKFVTWNLLGISSIAAGNWAYAFAARESNTSANFPAGAANSPVYVNCYVWRPSTQAIVGTILDGNTASVYAEVGAANSTRAMYGLFAGSAVASIQDDDVIVLEVWFRITQAAATAYTDTFYYDGTTENTILNATVSNHASYIASYNPLTFKKDVSTALPTETVNITESPVTARLKSSMRALATETVTKSESIARLNAKWRRIVNIERWL